MDFNQTKMIEEEQNHFKLKDGERFTNSGFDYTMSLINGKYKMTILYTISSFGVIRFNEMQRYIQNISFKTLSSNLKDLEHEKLIIRTEYPQIPPKVEYKLSELGESLIPILNAMCMWGIQHKDN